jgi:hypothetical protein
MDPSVQGAQVLERDAWKEGARAYGQGRETCTQETQGA